MADYILDGDRVASFGSYADQHELFDMFERILARLLIERPTDPLQWMIDHLQQPVVPAIVICGPPSSGTAEICEKVAVAHDAIYISTGDLLQAAIERQTSMGVQAKPFMERGSLVPDQIMLSLVMQRLQEPDVVSKGYVLEGFPRTREQAIAMQMKGLFPSHFGYFTCERPLIRGVWVLQWLVLLEVPDDVIIRRTIGLRLDPVTKTMYHLVFNPPPRSAAVESRLIQKTSHTLPAIRTRLIQYRRNLHGVTKSFTKTLRRFAYDEGIVGHEEQVLREVMVYIGTRKRTHAPRQFRILIAGLPGSGKSTLAALVEKKYGFVHVSPRKVVLEEMSADSLWAPQLKPYIDKPDAVPHNLMTELIIHRLKRSDCVNKGWILDGFPFTIPQAEELKANDIIPNRLIWLRAPEDICRMRLSRRRYDPTTGRVLNLENLPEGLTRNDPKKWSRRPEDGDAAVAARLMQYTCLHEDLERFYGYKRKGRTSTASLTLNLPPKETEGIMQEIEADGIGEGDGFGNNPRVGRVFELIEDALLHPVPVYTPLSL
ncbi:Adenylate kinase 8 [Irineochytrium annulatum]|nr:Adenylate kinase 8 [Irineochytrium annulatum]